jgi:cytochrome c oxidase subunit 2
VLNNWLPENASSYGADVDRIFYLIYYITAIALVGVLAGLVYFLFKYRAKAGGKATYNHGNTTLEIIWTIVPALVFIMLGFMSRSVWSQIKETLPETELRIKVTASQFNWQMTYPGPDGKLGTGDDYNQENAMTVPVNRPVRVVLTSKDVIHSFFLPNMRLKQDAVPGREIEVWFQANRTGDFEIPCAELCGFGHSNMKGLLKVETPEQFETWAREKKAFP